MLFNERKNSLLSSDRNKIRKQLYKKETVCNFLKEKEQNDSLTKVKRNY